MSAAHGLEGAWRRALLASVALLPFPGLLPEPWPGSGARWSDLPLAVALAVFACARIRDGGFRPAPWQAAAIGYAGWVGVSWLAHGAGALSGQKVLGVVSLVGTGVLASAFGPPAPLVRVVVFGVIASAALALAGLVLHALGFATPFVGSTGDLVAGNWARSQAGFTHPNLAASFALFAFGVAAAEPSPRLRWLARVSASVVAVTAFSRAVLSLLAWPPLLAGGRRGRLAAALVAVVLLALTFSPVNLDPSRPWDMRASLAPSPRAVAFGSALESFAASPLTGVGPGVLPARVDDAAFHAHCTPLNVAASYGLPALALLATACLGALRHAPSPAARATVIALLLDGLACDVEDFRHFWLALGLAAAPRSPQPGADD